MGKYKYVCPNNFTYISKRYSIPIVILRGFLWDGATLVIDINWKASCVHDAIYRFQDKHFKEIDRKTADLIYMDMLIENGFNEKLAKIRHIGLRKLGGIAWNINKNRLENDYVSVIQQSFLPHLGVEYKIPTIHYKDIVKIKTEKDNNKCKIL